MILFIVNLYTTVWKFQHISATQILREINFGHLESQVIAAAAQNSKPPQLIKWQVDFT